MCINLNVDRPIALTTARRLEETAPDLPVEPAPATSTPEQQTLIVHDQQIDASFYFDQQLNQVVITMTRAETGEVVRQIPQEHMRTFMLGMMELAGRLFDEKG